MTRNTPSRLALLVPGIVCLAVAGVVGLQLLRASSADQFWTPPEIAYSLQSSQPRVEVTLDGKPLQDVLDAGELVRASDGSRVESPAIKLRLNDRYRVTSVRLGILAAAAAAGIVLLLIAVLVPGPRSPLDRNA